MSMSISSVYRVCVGVGEVCAGAGVWWCGWLWMQGCWMQNRTVQSLAAAELACPPSVTPVVMQLQSEEGRNISLKCRVTGQYRHFHYHYHHYHYHRTIIVTITITSQHQLHQYISSHPEMPVNINRNISVLVTLEHMKDLLILPFAIF